MKKTLINKVIFPVVLGAGLLVGSGCSSICEKDPFVRQLVGGLPRVLQPGAYRDSIEKEEREKEREYQREMQGRREGRNNQNIIPENLYIRGGRYLVAPGYEWVNPSDDADLRVRKIK